MAASRRDPAIRWHTILAILVALAILAFSLVAPGPFIAHGAVGQVYLPIVTKTLGGPTGWTSPIVVQNTGFGPTDVGITFYKQSDGSPGPSVRSPQLKPGQAWTFDPRAEAALADNTQFSAVVQASNGQAAATVIQGSGSSWMSYSGIATGTSTVYLPNITRNLGGADGWNTPFYVQNTGLTATSATVSFYTFAEGALATKIEKVDLQPGRARAFVPSKIDGLTDDTQYAVVVQGPAGSQLYAVVNEISGGMAMSYEGLLSGAEVISLPNVLKYLGGTDHWVTPFIVQNLGASASTVTIEFYSFDTGALVTTYTGAPLQPGRSLPMDVRFTPATLPAGSYSVVVRGQKDARLGAVVNEVDPTAGMAMSYIGIGLSQALPSAYVPFLEKNAGTAGWVSPIIAQNLGTASTDVTLTLFDANGDIASQKVFTAVKPGAAAIYDPRFDRRLKNGIYSGLVQATTPIGAVVNHTGVLTGDYAMAFNAIAASQQSIPQVTAVTKQVGPYQLRLRPATNADVWVETSIDPATASRIVAQTEADVTRVQTDFGREFANLPTVYVFATADSYAMGLQTLMGYTTTEAQTITKGSDALFQAKTQLVLANWSYISPYQPQSAIRHELTHAMNSQIIGTNPTMPAWLDEGLAVSEELTLPGSDWLNMLSRYGTASMASTGTLFPIRDLTSPQLWSMRTGNAARYQYYESAQIVALLRADLGQQGIVRILELMGQGKPFEAAYQEVAGKPWSEFATAFPDRAKALAPSTPGVVAVSDSPIGPGLSFLAYGFPPVSGLVIEVRSNTTGDIDAVSTTMFGTRFLYLDKTWAPGTYNITVTSPTTTVSVIAQKLQ